MAQRIGLYGGSFDPIHFGHLISARSIGEQLGLSRIILIPAARPPHKPAGALADADHRLAMARLATGDDPLLEISDVEIRREGPSYTIDTVESFRGRLGEACELVWVIGADTLPELVTWHRIAELVNRARIVTATRPGAGTPDLSALERLVGAAAVERLISDRFATPAIDISATDIRGRVADGLPVRYLTPTAVGNYIESHGLYGP